MIGRASVSRATWLACVLWGLAACGGDDSSKASSSASPVAERPPVGATSLVYGLSSYYGGVGAEAVEPLMRHLSEELGIPVKMRVAEPYRELPALVLSHEVDIAQLAPHPYLHVRAVDPTIRPLVTPIVVGSPTYLGHLYVREDSRFHTLADLRGARVAWVTHESTSGYLFARDLIRRRGFDPSTFFSVEKFYWSHPSVLQAVLRGDADAGAAFDVTSDWSAALTERPRGLRVVAKTDRVPNDCVVARGGLDEGTIAAVEAAMLDLRADRPGSADVLSALRVNGWVRADERRYDRVRDVLAREWPGGVSTLPPAKEEPAEPAATTPVKRLEDAP